MAYNKTTWENAPSTNSPINASNLNKIEEGIYSNSLKADQVGDLSTLTTTAKSDLVSAINETNVKENYSTDEAKTNMTYGGKPVYTKTFTFSPMPNNSSAEFNTEIANLDLLFLDKNFSYFSWGGNRKYGIDNKSYNNISCWINNDNKIEVNSTRTDGANWYLNAVVLYTKTTE